MQSSLDTPIQTLPVTPYPVAAGALMPREIPYDYVAVFKLTGKRGNRIPQVINISIEGTFVAVSIAYSFIPPRIKSPDPKNFAKNLRAILDRIGGFPANVQPIEDPVPLASCLLARLCGINFTYTIIDSASGRELQNAPIHNLAGLGTGDGDRPFRMLPKPFAFAPRSTVRIEIEEMSEGDFLYKDAELHMVLHGYKVLGGVGG